MKTSRNVITRIFSGLLMAGLFTLAACTEDVEINEQDSQNIENEAATDGYYEDADDMAILAVAVESGASTGSRVSTSGRAGVKPADIRFSDCVTVTFEFANDNTQATPHGYITIDFGTGCTDLHGNTRKGKIKVEFQGRRFLIGSKIITTFDGYHINGIKIEGTRTVTNITGSTEDSPKFSVVLEDGKATWPDGSTATREMNITKTWVRGANPLQDELRVEGSASGSNRNTQVYQVEITEPLIYKRECAILSRVFMAVEGVKVFTAANGSTITIDYGSGTCDRVVTVTINGQSSNITINGED